MSNPGQSLAAQGNKASEPTCFKRGDIVWAKVRGYSWWPAKVSNSNLSIFDLIASFIDIGDAADQWPRTQVQGRIHRRQHALNVATRQSSWFRKQFREVINHKEKSKDLCKIESLLPYLLASQDLKYRPLTLSCRTSLSPLKQQESYWGEMIN